MKLGLPCNECVGVTNTHRPHSAPNSSVKDLVDIFSTYVQRKMHHTGISQLIVFQTNLGGNHVNFEV